MKKIICLLFIATGSFFFGINTVSAEAVDECLTQAQLQYANRVASCTKEVQEWYALQQENLTKGLEENISSCEQGDFFQACLDNYQTQFYRDIQQLSVEMQAKNFECSEGKIRTHYQNLVSVCYSEGDFGWVWEMPVLKKILTEQAFDYATLDFDMASKLGSCLENVSKEYDLNIVSAQVQREIAGCFRESGLVNIANVYESAGITIDCASETLDLEEGQTVLNFIGKTSPKQEEYIKKCIIKRTAPLVTGLAALNIPFASGFGNVFLYAQFLFTQPLVLVARRKKKTWGRVFNSLTSHPIDLGTVRLVDSKKGNVLKTMVTGKQGRYLFLPKPGSYRVEVDKAGFEFPSLFFKPDLDKSEHYFGEEISLKDEKLAIDRHIPIDPHEKIASATRFLWKKWRKRVAILLAFLAPLLAVSMLLFVQEWWSVLLVFVHVLLLLFFIRLSFTKKDPQFGRVYGIGNKSLGNVVVSLFRKEDNKLLTYYVTDMFGRYFLPIAAGEYKVRFEKKGFQKKGIDLNLTEKEAGEGIIKIDIELKRV